MQLKKIIVSLLIIFVGFAANAQCSMCRAVLESQDSGSAAAGINDGIMYLMVFPYLLIGIVGVVIYRMNRKGVAEKEN
ncbi:hypothetical protein [Haloflavibacter putidus]|uniref:Uncharacterized protein n=1 Tax=Haloflavibacter putidus TaxID=2576776 RepID=A0A508A1C5_9FLAO|nr:hypothetical protein [Haloflavibacter putidus]TQD39632.1 hypothetical protein FKR84_03810 [Haloflavibacter putidus]